MEITKEQINHIFDNAEHQHDYIISLYKLVVPDFENHNEVDWPECGTHVYHYIFEKAINFDRENHPGTLPGGAWMNYGFSFNENLDDWEIQRKT